jgi:molecular chaperone DnaJ
MSKRDYYEVLGLAKDAKLEDIKKAHKKLVKIHHPDRKGDENKFKEVQEAYERLSDTDKRAKYDAYGHNAPNHRNPFGQYEDMMRQHGFQQRRHVRKGGELRINIKLTLEEIYNGTHKKIKYKKQCKCESCQGKGGSGAKNCSTCNGAGRVRHVANTQFGQMIQESTCPVCNGEGQTVESICNDCHSMGTISKETIVELDIPHGVPDGSAMEMPGHGNAIKNGIDGKVDLETIDGGKIRVNVTPGTQVGDVLRLQNKGLKHVYQENRGDMFMEVSVEIPKEISNEEKEILEKLRK